MPKRAVFASILLGAFLVAPAASFAAATITIAGSTALLPLVKDAAGEYQAEHPDVGISVSGGGSGTGINQVAAKAVDIGDSDISALEHRELHDNRIAVVGFAVITHPGVPVKNLTKAQIAGIFSGKTRNWKEVGGPDQKIVVINRPRNSGTRAVFTKTIMGGVPVSDAGLVEDSTATVVSVVRQTPGAIGYAAFSGTLAQGLNELSIDGVAPTGANIMIGKYPVWSYEHMFTNGPPTDEIARFIAFVASGDDLIQKYGFIRISDMKVRETDR